MPVRIEKLVSRQPLRQRPAKRAREVVLLEPYLYNRVQVGAHVTDADIHRDILVLRVPHAAIRPIVAPHDVRTIDINVAWLGDRPAFAQFSRNAILVGICRCIADDVAGGGAAPIDQRLRPAVRPSRLYLPVD